ncbi:MAG: S23 ribosomal protein [Parcubacteria group bacterium Greene0714_7]|nr:MAG: S23 ribosomal protein [Parcubacteria group bacterium Greene0714_7]
MQTNKIQIYSHKDLVVWQKGIDLAIVIYNLTSKFPSEEKFGLTAQMRRAVVSISSNIAEGRSRSTRKDFAQFLHIALGSVSELETQLEIAKRLEYGEKVDYNGAVATLQEVSKMLVTIIASLKAKT